MHHHTDCVDAGNGPLALAEKRIFLYPEHKEQSENGKARNDGLKGDEEASEQEDTDQIDIL